MFEFAKSHVEGVTSFFVESHTIITHAECLESWLAGAKTFKGTRSHHQFIPSKNSLIMKKTSKSVCSKEVILSAGENSKLKISAEDNQAWKVLASTVIMIGASAMQTTCW